MTEELLNALKLIKAECGEHDLGFYQNCSDCPLNNSNNECGVMNCTPCRWELKKREVYF